MTAYVLTEAQMKAHWALERRANRPDVRATFAAELEALEAADDQAQGLPVEGTARIAGERMTHPGRGWTAEHDLGHAHQLVDAASCYLKAGIYRPGTVPPSWPWAPHYWKPSDDVVRNLEKAGSMIAATIDTIEAQRKNDTALGITR